MNSEVIFYQKVNERRVNFSEVGRAGFNARAVLYINAACSYAKVLNIPDLPFEPVQLSDGDDAIQEALFKLEGFMDKVKAENLFDLEPNLREASVYLDQEWKSHATTLVSHIREVVTRATMADDLREPILRSLNQLQSEIDRNRTRLERVSDAWLQITSAIGNGAENLEPAVKLIERLSKAMGKAKRHEIEAEKHPQLPPPPDELKDEQ
ncbi:hypothetical protein MB818_07945 [Ruegeria sp. 1NDH52C]|uniref:Uncharacterized protein n=1 Tax=Ruegeria alba TaxID=2916756 RepID=A0ABS9NV79_9RHOB|nr:hypothetical protein [Ruegeria alba]MCG6558127.1 hypothetical protein [Ruegeria alba]